MGNDLVQIFLPFPIEMKKQIAIICCCGFWFEFFLFVFSFRAQSVLMRSRCYLILFNISIHECHCNARDVLHLTRRHQYNTQDTDEQTNATKMYISLNNIKVLNFSVFFSLLFLFLLPWLWAHVCVSLLDWFDWDEIPSDEFRYEYLWKFRVFFSRILFYFYSLLCYKLRFTVFMNI